jgi:hypothetical protein
MHRLHGYNRPFFDDVFDILESINFQIFPDVDANAVRGFVEKIKSAERK